MRNFHKTIAVAVAALSILGIGAGAAKAVNEINGTTSGQYAQGTRDPAHKDCVVWAGLPRNGVIEGRGAVKCDHRHTRTDLSVRLKVTYPNGTQYTFVAPTRSPTNSYGTGNKWYTADTGLTCNPSHRYQAVAVASVEGGADFYATTGSPKYLC
ncbi:MAG TPA: hypothetical protein VMZ22_10120 [Acidimicrobiales bacterium]|nr:hypothetical protein [Acidimicrobiales bacterium]